MDMLPAEIDDAPEILALQRLAYQAEAVLYDDFAIPPLTQTLDALRAEFSSHVILKAVVDGRLVGSVRGCQLEGTCRVGRLIVHPDHQGRGIGTALLRGIEKHFPSAVRFELFTGHRSERNIRLYERVGYRIVRHQIVNDRLTLIFLHKNGNSTNNAASTLQR
jgi:ribosomal protein S18 acetylase RimI-like enzyme